MPCGAEATLKCLVKKASIYFETDDLNRGVLPKMATSLFSLVNFEHTYRFILIRGHNGHTHRAGLKQLNRTRAGEMRRGSA